MISPSDLMKRVGVGGRLVAFFKAVCVYFVMGGGESAGAVAAKCAPIICLLLIVVHRATQHHKTNPRRRYGLLITFGLALSAIGDALLAVCARIEPGMAAFAGAHVAYLAAFGGRKGGARGAAIIAVPTAAYCSILMASLRGPLRVLVPLYSTLLAAMCWRGTARGGAAAIGSVLFLISDAVLGYTMFVNSLPYGQVMVMSTYYLGQLGIALSALEPEPTHLVDVPNQCSERPKQEIYT